MANPTLFFVRHGETQWNSLGRLQGQRDSDLTALGRQQALESGEILHELAGRDSRDLAQLYYVASPLGRARATMEHMRAGLGLDPNDYGIDARLGELSFGRWEGVSYAELQAREPDLLAARERDKWNFAPPGGESYAALLTRVTAWHATVPRDSVIVAHGGTARALVALRGIAEPEQAATYSVDQGVVYVFAGCGLARYA
jgi:probable phosphoglycerate mutase